MENYLSNEERNSILKNFEEFCKTRSVEGYHMSYAFGWISAMLTDEQVRELGKVAK
jgi:hypothetical protein